MTIAQVGVRNVDPKIRFWRNIDKVDNGCWLWKGSVNQWKHGSICIGGRKGKHVSVHRFSWELHNGPIPNDLFVLHKCDNPPCVNPEHLFLGTQRDNLKDMFRKGRNNPPYSKNKILTPETTNKVRLIYSCNIFSMKEIADKLSVSEMVISNIIHNRDGWDKI